MVGATSIPHEIVRALSFAVGMTWEILWALILGFTLSGVVQAVVSKREMRRLMPDDSARTLVVATGLGAASSSCSYASVALARSLFKRGADFTAAMVFQFASTNLVFELGIVMALLLGWQFVLGEFVGGPVMIVLLVVLFRLFLKRRLVDEARREAERGRLGSMEGHAEMDMSAEAAGSWWQRLRTPQGLHRDRRLLRHGLGGGLARHRRRAPDRRRARGLGAALVLAGAVSRPPSDARQALGAADRTAGGDRQLRLLGRQRAARRRPVERRHQLRRRPDLHLRRPDDPADPRTSTGSTTAGRWPASCWSPSTRPWSPRA